MLTLSPIHPVRNLTLTLPAHCHCWLLLPKMLWISTASTQPRPGRKKNDLVVCHSMAKLPKRGTRECRETDVWTAFPSPELLKEITLSKRRWSRAVRPLLCSRAWTMELKVNPLLLGLCSWRESSSLWPFHEVTEAGHGLRDSSPNTKWPRPDQRWTRAGKSAAPINNRED